MRFHFGTLCASIWVGALFASISVPLCASIFTTMRFRFDTTMRFHFGSTMRFHFGSKILIISCLNELTTVTATNKHTN